MERDTREQILTVAESVFAEKGFDGARVKDIAARVGVTHAVIHYHFNTKGDLYRAVADRMVGELLDMATSIPQEPLDPGPKLERFFCSFFDFAARHPHFARLANLETGDEGERYLLALVREQLAPQYQRARGFILRGVAAGVFRPVDPEHLLTAIYGMIVSYFGDSPFIAAITGGEGLLTEAALEQRRAELMRMILRTVLVNPPA
ncbi:MAG: TetR/AcrR family transcriptional regulator [Pseudomonadota bacterium]